MRTFVINSFIVLFLCLPLMGFVEGCSENNDLLSYFEEVSFDDFVLKKTPIPSEKDKKPLPDKVVANQLLFVRNNLFNHVNGHPIKYYPLFKVKGTGYWLIVYYSSDCSERKTFYSIFSDKNKKVTKELLVEDLIHEVSLVSFKIDAHKAESLNDVLIYVEDRRTPGNVEPFVSYRIDEYKLDKDFTYINTCVYRGNLVETKHSDNYSSNDSEEETIEQNLLDYFETRTSIPSFSEALDCCKIIPDIFLFDIFSHDPVRENPYNIFGAIKKKIKDGWLLYIIRSNGIEADAYLCNYLEGGAPYSFLHIFNGSEVDRIAFDTDYIVSGDKLTISNFIKENDKHKSDIIIQDYTLK